MLSDSTEAFDRGDKFFDYMQLDGLQEYVLINTRQQQIECFRRNAEGQWILQLYRAEQQQFQLQSIQFEATLAAVYEDVVLEPSPPVETERG